MAFFDKQQDVIDIKLTRYGKNLLSRGKFRPMFYRLFDDDILYNSENASIVEEQNDSEDRIKTTPRLKTLYLSAGVETSFDTELALIESGELSRFRDINQDLLVNELLLKYPLETHVQNSQTAPAFLVSLPETLSGGTVDFLDVKGVTLPVPQINMSAVYELVEDRTKVESLEGVPLTEKYIDFVSEEILFTDQTKISTVRNDIGIDILENNIDFSTVNLELEIYERIEVTNSEGEIVEELIKIDDPEILKQLFEIRADESTAYVPRENTRNRNFYGNRKK